MNDETKAVTVRGKPLALTAKEYAILELLLKNPKKVFSKGNLFESVWQEPYAYDDNTVNTHVCNLRNKLKAVSPGEEYVETVWGFGYKLNGE
jgi:DNA-binding response OmpR family regulator